MHQSIAAAPIHPPANFGAFARIVSPGGRALAYPRVTPGLFDTHVVYDSKSKRRRFYRKRPVVLSLIGLSVKDWTKLWRFLKVFFLDLRHFLIVYQATTLKRDRERSL